MAAPVTAATIRANFDADVTGFIAGIVSVKKNATEAEHSLRAISTRARRLKADLEAGLVTQRQYAQSMDLLRRGAVHVGSEIGTSSRAVGVYQSAIRNTAAAHTQGIARTVAYAGALSSATAVTQRSILGSAAMRTGLVALTAQMTGTNAVTARLGSTMLLFGAGSTATVGIVAGIAAIALAYRRLGADAREAREEQEKIVQAGVAANRTFQRGDRGAITDQLAAATLRRREAQQDMDQLLLGRQRRAEGFMISPRAISVEAENAIQTRITEAEQSEARLRSALNSLSESTQRVIEVVGITFEAILRQANAVAARIDIMTPQLSRLIATSPVAQAARTPFRVTPEMMAGPPGVPGGGLRDLSGRRRPPGVFSEEFLGTRPPPVEPAAQDFSQAAVIAIGSFQAMAQAAISGTAQMEQIIIASFGNIAQVLAQQAGGPVVGALVGAGAGILGALFGGRDPVPVRIVQDDTERGTAFIMLEDGTMERVVIRTLENVSQRNIVIRDGSERANRYERAS